MSLSTHEPSTQRPERPLRALLLALVILATASCTQPARTPGGETASGPLREWYYSGAWIQEEAREGGGAFPRMWSPANEWLVALNLGSVPTDLETTFYYEERPPSTQSWRVGPQATSAIPLHDTADLPTEPVRFGVRIRSREPIIIQPTRGESPPGESVTGAMSSYIAYPGPLGQKETRWAYADGLILASRYDLEEREWIAILNPHPASDAHIELVFLVGGERITEDLTVPAERIRVVDLFNTKSFPRKP